ncbi:MAG TPA: hypothetical protein VJQ44_12460 [Gemmatimonadales bacterium]|nr:hypothetical protein [Gemmatimonadales bacterium]
MTLALLAALGSAALGSGDFKCNSNGLSTDELLPRAHVALDLAGTQQVGPGSGPGCIAITVRSEGTARLVLLALRGVDVPPEAAEIFVVKQTPGGDQ